MSETNERDPHYQSARHAFDELRLEDKAAFVVESTVATMADFFKQAAGQITDLFQDLADRAAEATETMEADMEAAAEEAAAAADEAAAEAAAPPPPPPVDPVATGAPPTPPPAAAPDDDAPKKTSSRRAPKSPTDPPEDDLT